MEVERLETALTVNDRDLRRGLQEAQRLTNDYARKMDSALSGVGQGFGSSSFLDNLSNISNIISAMPAIGTIANALVTPLTNAARAGVMFNATWESAHAGFTTIVGDSDRALKHLTNLQRFAESTPFEFSGLLKSSRYMNTFGFQITEHIPKLTAWGNALSASGDISEEAMQRVVRAFGQMTTLGRAKSEEMNQLAEAGIPSWELLAKAIGRTVEETRELTERGKLKGRESMEAITAMMEIDPRFANQMAIQSKTLLGLMSNAEDLKARAQGLAARGLTGDIKGILESGLNQAGMAESLAVTIDAAITPVSGIIRASAKMLLGGGISEGLAEGINAGKELVNKAIGELGLGAISTFAQALKIFSPSQVFYSFGLNIGEGLALGIEDGMMKVKTRSGETFQEIADRHRVAVESLIEANRQLADEIVASGKLATTGALPGGRELSIPGSALPGKRGKASRRGAVGLGGVEGLLSRAYLEQAAQDPRVRAMLEALRIVEGGEPDIVVGGRRFDRSNPAHPGTYGMGMMGPKGWSTAAGSWQVTGSNWKKLAPQLGLNNFGDVNQQMIAALALYQQSGGLSALLSGNMQGAFAGTQPWAASPFSTLPGRKRQDFASLYQEQLGKSVGWIPGAGLLSGQSSPPSKSNPLPVVVVDVEGGHRVTELDRAGGFGAFNRMPLPEVFMSAPSVLPDVSKWFDALPIIKAQTILDTFRLMSGAVDDIGKAFESTKPGIGEWFKTVSGGSIDVYKNLKQIERGIPTLGEQFDTLTVNAPQTIGGIFGDAAREFDGTFRGFGRSIVLGVADSMREFGAQVLENAITKGASSILQSIFKPGEKEVVAALDKAFQFTPLEQGFGINTTAVTINTTSTDLNTLALNQNTAAMRAEQAAQSAASGGGGLWSGLLGAVVNAITPGLGGIFSGLGGGGDAMSGGTFSTEVTGYEINPPGHALGAWINSKSGGHLVRVGEGGFSEMILSTNPALKERTSRLLSDFIKRTDILPKFERGGWAEGMGHQGITSLALDRSDHSFAPNYSQQVSNQYGTQTGGVHHHHYTLNISDRAARSYSQPRKGDDMLAGLAREIDRLQRNRR